MVGAGRYIVSQIFCPVCSNFLNENEMAKERALTLEVLQGCGCDRSPGQFVAAADELGRVPSALSYTMQKLEEGWMWCCLTARAIAPNSPMSEDVLSEGAFCWKPQIN